MHIIICIPSAGPYWVSDELSRLREALERDDGIMQHSYGRDDGHGRSIRMCLWFHPGNDITGMVGRCEKVAGTMEQVSQLIIRHVAVILVA